MPSEGTPKQESLSVPKKVQMPSEGTPKQESSNAPPNAFQQESLSVVGLSSLKMDLREKNALAEKLGYA